VRRARFAAAEQTENATEPAPSREKSSDESRTRNNRPDPDPQYPQGACPGDTRRTRPISMVERSRDFKEDRSEQANPATPPAIAKFLGQTGQCSSFDENPGQDSKNEEIIRRMIRRLGEKEMYSIEWRKAFNRCYSGDATAKVARKSAALPSGLRSGIKQDRGGVFPTQ